MSFSDRCTQLEKSFRLTSCLLRDLLQGLQTRRIAWGSARASMVVPSPELEQLAQQLAREETVRAELITQIRLMLPAPPGANATSTHVNVTRIAAALPTAAAHSLREAADEATALAKSVRVEVTLGQRLLQFTRHVQENLLAGTAGIKTPRLGASVYDRNARADRTGGTRGERGVLVDGKI
ncbi:MAG: hypothetical protein JNM25_07455 [Planctomycetes bacterium]|nr:hypothetical protein [Planctomycetota bacterium]